VSRYTHALAARARGGALVVRAWRTPRFVPATGTEPSRPELPVDAASPALAAAEPADRREAAVVAERAPAFERAITAAAAGDHRRGPSLHRAARPDTGDRVPAPRVAVPESVRTKAPAVEDHAAPRLAAPATVHAQAPVPAAVRDATAPAAPVRTAPRLPAPLPATGAAAAAAPRIEVHIGRVEVSAPRPAAAPPPIMRPPAAQRQHGGAPPPAGSGFGELAAARRHVDRIAR
jgi:hypothetical protein